MCTGVRKVLGRVSNDCPQSENCRLALAMLAEPSRQYASKQILRVQWLRWPKKKVPPPLLTLKYMDISLNPGTKAKVKEWKRYHKSLPLEDPKSPTTTGCIVEFLEKWIRLQFIQESQIESRQGNWRCLSSDEWKNKWMKEEMSEQMIVWRSQEGNDGVKEWVKEGRNDWMSAIRRHQRWFSLWI